VASHLTYDEVLRRETNAKRSGYGYGYGYGLGYGTDIDENGKQKKKSRWFGRS